MIIAMALYHMLGTNNDFKNNVTAATLSIFFVGLFGLIYSSYVSEERFITTALAMTALTALWFFIIFGAALAIYTLTKTPWYLYGAGALACGLTAIGLIKYLAGQDENTHA